MSICALATHDTHCHLLLGLKSLDMSKESSQAAAMAAINALDAGQPLPQLLYADELHSEEIAKRVESFISSEVECFDFYSTCYKDAKLAHEVLTAYHDALTKAGKIAHLGVGLHPYWLTEDYSTELNALCALIEHIHITSPHLLVSLGEIGLDKRLDLSMDIQCRFMQDFITRTVHYNLPYSCHCVRAYNELDRLFSSLQLNTSHRKNAKLQSEQQLQQQEQLPNQIEHHHPQQLSQQAHQRACVTAAAVAPRVRAIIHGFNGSVGTAKILLSKGYRLGIGKAILAHNNHKKFGEITALAQQAALGLCLHAAVGDSDDGDGATWSGKGTSVSAELLGFESDYDGSTSSEYDGQLLRLIYKSYTRLQK